MYRNSVLINSSHGIHLRIAAQIVHMAESIKEKYKINLYITKSIDQEPIAFSMLALLSLRIRQNEIVEICCKEESIDGRNAVLELCDFIYKQLNEKNSEMENIDYIIEESAIANDQILENIPLGILVIDQNSTIVRLNDYGLKLIDRELKEITGRPVREVIPTSDLPIVLSTGKSHLGKIQHINGKVVIVNRSPIFSGDKVIGAVGVFQDISELVGMKELNEKLTKILEASHDLICFVDEDRKISYINPAYEKHFSKVSENIIGKDLYEVSPKGIRMKVFNTKKKIENVVYNKDGEEMVATIEPLFIDNNFKGIISISRPVNQIKDLLKKLEESEEKLNFYKEELFKTHKAKFFV